MRAKCFVVRSKICGGVKKMIQAVCAPRGANGSPGSSWSVSLSTKEPECLPLPRSGAGSRPGEASLGAGPLHGRGGVADGNTELGSSSVDRH